MRASTARWAVVTISILAVTGCRSGAGRWPSWRMGSKEASLPGLASAPQYPLPSAGATPSTANNPYSAAPASPYGPGAYSGTYPETPANYAGTSGSQGAANDPYSYGSPAGTDPLATTQDRYPQIGAGATMAPQSGPYPGVYGQPAGTTPQTLANPYAGDSSAAPPAGSYEQSTTTAPYSRDSAGATGSYGASGTYPSGSSSAGHESVQGADSRWGTDSRYDTGSPYDQGQAYPSAGSYRTAETDTAPYEPGQTDYQPGNTGYAPAGVPPYRSPAAPYSTSPNAGRTDPHYRPGGTGDYVPAGGTPIGPASRAGSEPARSPVQPASFESPRYGASSANAGSTADRYGKTVEENRYGESYAPGASVNTATSGGDLSDRYTR